MKRIYFETVKKWAIRLGIPTGVVGTGIGLIFLFLSLSGAITITGFFGDQVCAGTIEDPCYAYINLTANEDIFIYPLEYDPWGRNTPFEFSPAVKDWKLQRSWGNGWRDIPLDKTCTGKWCGAPNNQGVAYSWVMRKDRDYQVRIVALKENPYDTIKWAVNYEDKEYLDPTWLSPYESNYTSATETHCINGKCEHLIHSATKFAFEDNQWKKIEDARSLKGIYDVIYLEKEDAFNLEVVDFNYTDIEFRAIFEGDPNDYPDFCTVKSEEEFKCQFKNTIKWDEEGIEQTLKYDLKYEMKKGEIVANNTKFSYKGNPLNKEFKFGGNSTTIIINDTSTGVVANIGWAGTDMATYASSASAIKFDIESISTGNTINSVLVYLWIFDVGGTMDSDLNISRITNQTWVDSGDFCEAINPITYTNIEAETLSSIVDDTWSWFNVTEQFNVDYEATNQNFTIYLEDPDNHYVDSQCFDGDADTLEIGDSFFTGDYIDFEARNNSQSTGNTPYLNVTYIEAPADTCTYSSGDWNVDCNDNCSISAAVHLGGNDLIFSGLGSFWVRDNIAGIGNLNLSDSCNIILEGKDLIFE